MSIRNVPSIQPYTRTIATSVIIGMFTRLSFRLELASDEISNLQTSVTKVIGIVQKMDQKMDTIASNPDDTQRSLPRPPSVDRRLTVNNSQSQSQ